MVMYPFALVSQHSTGWYIHRMGGHGGIAHTTASLVTTGLGWTRLGSGVLIPGFVKLRDRQTDRQIWVDRGASVQEVGVDHNERYMPIMQLMYMLCANTATIHMKR